MSPSLFHGFIAVAPLKSVRLEAVSVCLHSLPRLHRRGPIEVLYCGPGESVIRTLFHGFIAVAPLKSEASARTLLDQGLFHGFIAVAPLK